MPLFTDQICRKVEIAIPAKKIISVVPSQTELLYHLGLDIEVVGITKFCVHPIEWHQQKLRVGGTKNIDISKVIALQPQLVLANKEENTKDQIETISKYCPVWVSDVYNLATAYEMMAKVGQLTGKEKEADQLIYNIKHEFDNQLFQNPLYIIKVAYLIWRKPYMTVGGDTFIHQMLGYAGLVNVFGHFERYPQITISDLQASGCEVLLLSSEPFPFKQKHIEELSHHLPDTKILLVDGEIFSWYGSRLLQAPYYLRQLQSAIIKAKS